MSAGRTQEVDPAGALPEVLRAARPLAWAWAHRQAILGGLLLLGALALYERTEARTVRWGDPGEFQLAAVVLGVPHPPGYPLWVLVAHLFYLVPVGEPLWRISLTSVVYGTATVGLVYLIAHRLGVRWWLAGAVAALFAIAPDFWGEATEPRAYALNAVQVAGTIWLLLKWRDAPPEQRRRWLAAAGFVLGTAFANHGTTITLVPGYALFVLGTEARWARAAGESLLLTVRRRLPDYLLAAGAGLLGLTPYVLPLVRFLQGGGPYYWGEPHSWGDFLRLLSGQDFREMIFGIPWAQFGAQAGWGIEILVNQYTWLGVIAGLVGWAVLARRQPLVFGMLALGWGCSFVFAIMYNAATNYFYFIPGHLFWALAMGVAGEAFLDGRFRLSVRKMDPPKANIQTLKSAGLAVLVVAALVVGVVARYPSAGWQRKTEPRDQAEIVFRELPHAAIIYVGWEASSVIKYYQLAEGRRTDLILKAGDPHDWAGHMRDFMTEGWPVYVTEPPDSLFQQFKLTPVGFTYHVEFK